MFKGLFFISAFMFYLSAFAQGASDEIRLGSILALKGKAKGIGIAVRLGLDAALLGQKVRGIPIRLIFENDFYEPEIAKQKAQKLVSKDIFMAIGNVGTPTAKVTLPIFAENNIPAFGFFTGAKYLRPGPGATINYRASYFQETEKIIDSAVSHGVNPSNICAYVQNDSFGFDGLLGVYNALKKHKVDSANLLAVRRVLDMKTPVDNRELNAPVGVYRRNSIMVRDGMNALLEWEKSTRKHCDLIVTVGTYVNIAHLVRINKERGDRRIISAVSFTGAGSFAEHLKKYDATERVVLTQVTPLIESNLPIVKEARKKLGDSFDNVSLEGFIVGKLALNILKRIKGKITRDKFVKVAKRTKANLGGVRINFRRNGYQGSNLVISTYLNGERYKAMTKEKWMRFVQDVSIRK